MEQNSRRDGVFMGERMARALDAVSKETWDAVRSADRSARVAFAELSPKFGGNPASSKHVNPTPCATNQTPSFSDVPCDSMVPLTCAAA